MKQLTRWRKALVLNQTPGEIVVYKKQGALFDRLPTLFILDLKSNVNGQHVYRAQTSIASL